MVDTKEPLHRSNKRQNKKEMKNQKGHNHINWWMWAFILLFSIILGAGIFIGKKVLTPIQANEIAEKNTKKESTFSVHLNKAQVNSIVDYYLTNYLKSSNVKYSFRLDNQAILSGEFKLLNYPINFSLYFDPYVMENGNIQLKAKKLSLGELDVPISIVMNYIGQTYKIPNWVTLNSKDKTIVLKLNQFKMKNSMQLKAEKIDLVNNQVDMGVYLPLDSTTN